MADVKTCITIYDTDKGRSIPPTWVAGDIDGPFWYHENEHGEQWVARIHDGKIEFAGMDLGWKGFVLDQKTAEIELTRIRTYVATGEAPPPLMPGVSAKKYAEAAASLMSMSTFKLPMSVAGVILNDGELFWIASVIAAARFHLSSK